MSSARFAELMAAILEDLEAASVTIVVVWALRAYACSSAADQGSRLVIRLSPGQCLVAGLDYGLNSVDYLLTRHTRWSAATVAATYLIDSAGMTNKGYKGTLLYRRCSADASKEETLDVSSTLLLSPCRRRRLDG